MTAKVFREFSPEKLETKLNEFLGQYPDSSIVDVKYSMAMPSTDPSSVIYTSLVLVKKH